MVCYVYFIRNKSQDDGKHTKIGKSICVGNRIQTLETSFSIYAIELDYLIVCDNEEQMNELETYLHDYFNKYSTKKI